MTPTRDTRVRGARPADLDALLELEADLFGADAWGRASMAAELADSGEGRVFLVAIVDGDVQGYAVARTGPGDADLLRVGVRPEHRRRGMATGLLGGVVTRAVADGCDQLLLEVACDNGSAIALYQRLGFQRLAVRTGYYVDGQDAVVMRLDLSVQALDEQRDA